MEARKGSLAVTPCLVSCMLVMCVGVGRQGGWRGLHQYAAGGAALWLAGGGEAAKETEKVVVVVKAAVMVLLPTLRLFGSTFAGVFLIANAIIIDVSAHICVSVFR